jgi:uncharacterized protein YPO0396
MDTTSTSESAADYAVIATQRTAPPHGGLFYMPGATTGTLQWKAETFQLVNWGGFEGRVSFTFNPGSTLISGHSGTGKSTMLDAYIALMMPSDTPFNGASNDAVGGRARSSTQRSLLSYLRGKIDSTADADTGREIDQLLRGKGTSTWGAVGMTFIDDHGRRFTAFRVYLVPARATRDGEIVKRMVTCEGSLDLADLHPLAAQSFAPQAIKAAFPGVHTHETYSSFSTQLFTRLGIGANGDGAKALRLLVRIQSGHQIKTVDDLYKEMVLEEPATFAAADKALNHFDDLEASYLAMQTEKRKADLLSPIVELHQTMVDAEAEIVTLDTFGLTAVGDTPVSLWRLRTEERLLDTAAEANRLARISVADQLKAAKEVEGRKDRELEEAKQQHRDSGGAALEQLGGDIEDATRLRDERRQRRQILQGNIVALRAPLTTRAEFEDLRATGAAFLVSFEDAAKRVRDSRDQIVREQVPLMDEKKRLREERASLAGRDGRVDKYLDDLRTQAAAAAGMSVDELPFVAELLDIAAEHSQWRTAIETVLGASARTMLVPAERFAEFSMAIDPLHLRGVLNFQGAPHQNSTTVHADPATIAGKLLFKDSPFQAWVQSHVSEPSRNAICVETAAELDGAGYRVTRAGQTRRGTRGSHGRANRSDIIGFSSADAIAEIDRRLNELETLLTAVDGKLAANAEQLGDLERLRIAHTAVQNSSWDDIDDGSVDTRISELTRRRQDILDSDDTLRALAAQIVHLRGELEEARSKKFELSSSAKALETEQTALVDNQDKVTDELIRIEQDGRITLDDSQQERLDSEFRVAVGPGNAESLDEFDTNLKRLFTRLHEALKTARTNADRAAGELVRIFNAYQELWEDPNLGRGVASYRDYAEILDNILSTGLHERRAQWRKRLTEWSGQDLVPLAGAMDASIEEIEDRLDPINSILSKLPFGANQDRLRIKLRRLTHEHVTAFRKELRTLSSAATKDLPEEQLETRFKDLQQFMAQMRKRDDPRARPDTSDRDRLLDVRKHVEITAERYDNDGTLLSVHSSLGGKSGGESQELVAFIVGAALRFRLGDEARERPRFAPVFLDEGFIKADAEFAGRAVQAWKGLGFQLIVGAPLDKVTALDPHMNDLLIITKNTKNGYSFVFDARTPTAPA